MYLLFKEFYFDSQVWGTVSDWVMIGVTAATAYYLYQTLQSQRETQELQQKITKIEEYDYLTRIKPDFKISASKYTCRQQIPGGPIIVNCPGVITVVNHDAKSIKVTCRSYKNNELLQEVESDFESWESGYAKSFPMDKFYLNRNGLEKFHITYNIIYEDVDGNQYKKRMKIDNKKFTAVEHDYPAVRV